MRGREESSREDGAGGEQRARSFPLCVCGRGACTAGGLTVSGGGGASGELEDFAAARTELDPHNVLGNLAVDRIFGRAPPPGV